MTQLIEEENNISDHAMDPANEYEEDRYSPTLGPSTV